MPFPQPHSPYLPISVTAFPGEANSLLLLLLLSLVIIVMCRGRLLAAEEAMQAQAEKLSSAQEEKARLDVHLQHSQHQLAAAQAAAAAAGQIQDGDLHLLKAQLKVCTSQRQPATVWCEIATLACRHMPCRCEPVTVPACPAACNIADSGA